MKLDNRSAKANAAKFFSKLFVENSFNLVY
jgi:hypothetical protein